MYHEYAGMTVGLGAAMKSNNSLVPIATLAIAIQGIQHAKSDEQIVVVNEIETAIVSVTELQLVEVIDCLLDVQERLAQMSRDLMNEITLDEDIDE